ncbi:endonuclease/exonuclease/phosphatase family protein [bacterium]|nr:MAG: endonuclease/exonuclease/phosphatase family protein [bacterium]
MTTLLASLAMIGPSLSVMSFNIRYGTASDGENRWEVRKPRTLSYLAKARPAVIGLQEVLDFQLDDIREALPGYETVGIGRNDGKEAGEFSAIAYDANRLRVLRSDTFWLSDTPEVVASTGWGNAITRICTWAYFKDTQTGKFFYFFNVHLDHESQPAREKGVSLILKRIAARITPDPVILTGDFNAGEENAAVTLVKAGSLLDSFRVKHPDVKDVGTFSGWAPKLGPDKIDYIFVQPGVQVVDAEIVRDKVDGFWVSDHTPVTATLTLP